MTDHWLEPKPAPITAISPSGLSSLLTCPKRFAYQRDSETAAWERDSPSSCLGTVAHRLTEEVSRGKAPEEPTERKDWLKTRWEELVESQHIRLEKQWPGRVVPQPHTWRGYAATKVRLIRRLVAVQADRSSHAPDEVVATQPSGSSLASGKTNPPPLPWVERKLIDDAHGMYGTPDRVEETEGRLRVVDLKSGVAQSQVTDAQTRQLRFYAHLVECAIGRRPDVGVIVDATGAESEVAMTASDLHNLFAQVRTNLDAYARLASAQSVPASASAEACRWCSFRVVCSDYWHVHDDSWEYRSGICGEVVERSQEEVRVRQTMPERESDQVVRLILTGEEDPQVGDTIVAVDLDPAGVHTYRMRWNSPIHLVARVIQQDSGARGG